MAPMILDLSGESKVANVINDWKFLCDVVKIREDSRYLHHDMRQNTPGQTMTPRRKGQFYWRQFSIFKELGIRTVFVGMFDGVDEAATIYKVSNDIPVEKYFATYERMLSD